MINDKYIISVSEPWDFKSPDGENVIKGEVINKKDDYFIVFKSDYYLEFNGVKSNILILKPRCYNFSTLGDKIITINVGLLYQQYNEFLSQKELEDKLKFVIIGSIEKENR